MTETTSRAEPASPDLDHALQLADEYGMSVVLVRLRAPGEPEIARQVLAEAELEVAEMLVWQEWTVWHREVGESAAWVVVDGAPRSLKQALVELEDDHDLGPAWNLDLVTLMDGGPDVWHASPARPQGRPAPKTDLGALASGYAWSEATSAQAGEGLPACRR